MGVENQLAASDVVCGACDDHNHGDAKFCKSCGQSLYEQCVDCGYQVLLSQRFCGSCGSDLHKNLQKQHDQHQVWMAMAVDSAKQYDFDNALALLRRIASNADYRFRESAENAQEAMQKVKAMQQRADETSRATLAKANEEFANGNHQQVVQLLESIPEQLLNEDAKRIIRHARSHAAEVTELEQSLKEGIAKKDWVLVGGVIDQLLTHNADKELYQQIARQVSDKLTKQARKLFDTHCYAKALDRLQSVPSIERNEDFDRLWQTLDDANWLSTQSQNAAFATPMLGRLAVRFAKEAGGNSDAQAEVKKLASTLKTAERLPRCPFPIWRGYSTSWMGGDVAMLGLPTSIDLGEDNVLPTIQSRFHVAIGLALQGLGRARVTEQFRLKKGRFKSLNWRKSKSVWGVDVGASAIKAVCLSETDDEVSVTDSYFCEYPNPVCRSGESDKDSPIADAVSKLIEEKELGDTPVWVNVPAAELINRFVRLPPVTTKQAQQMLDAEIKHRIPIPREDLSIVSWMSEGDDAHGRAAMITAAKRSVVEHRYQLLADLGLSIAGMQGDTIATVNFIQHEYAEFFGNNDEPDEQPDSDSSEASMGMIKVPTLAFVESGASTTSLILVSSETHWIWSFESAGEDLTTALARSTKSTRNESEQLKRNPAAIEHPATQYLAVERRMNEGRSRLEKAFAEATQQNQRFDVTQTWCLGGGCLAHQWINRLLLEN